jgi:hypothetical protein
VSCFTSSLKRQLKTNELLRLNLPNPPLVFPFSLVGPRVPPLPTASTSNRQPILLRLLLLRGNETRARPKRLHRHRVHLPATTGKTEHVGRVEGRTGRG